MSSIKRETWVHLSPVMVDDRGTTVPDWSQPVEASVNGCRFQPLAGDELTELGRQGIVERGTLYAPFYIWNAHDRARSPDGVVYEVDGPPRNWESPTGYLRHQEVPLRRVTG